MSPIDLPATPLAGTLDGARMDDSAVPEVPGRLPVVARQSLAALCEELMILADSEPSPENAALHEQWLAEMGQQSTAARNKVDRVVMFIRRLESEIEWAKQEAAYYAERARGMQAGLERVKEYCVRTVQEYAPEPPVDKHGKPRHAKRLQGRAGYLAIQQNPASVVVDDDKAELLPERFQVATIKLRGEILYRLRDVILDCDSQLLGIFDQATTVAADRKALKVALESGEQIHGADLQFGSMRLALPRAGKDGAE